MTTHLDSDRALENKAEDKFGFVGLAKRLAPSIVEASKGDGMVIGLEGSWGSGKTSLLNFLRIELGAAKAEGVHTITIAPWLNGDTSPMVGSLLQPMAEILNKQEKETFTGSNGLETETKQKMAEISQLLRDYGPKTARGAASIANFAKYVLPSAEMIGGVFEAGATVLEQVMPSGPTPSELKQKIVLKIQELNMGFIVILDDLDRLEPEQAVEVIRLVRSVADFPRVAYLMCYDREVLAQALESGLKVADGDLFLQKIVQLTFNIPLPEPFDLRTQFFDEAKSIYTEVMGVEIEGDVLEDLNLAVDREGVGLTTPREVKLALNSIRFLFPQIKHDVHFPDFCRLQLIKITQYKLYKWLEIYLSLRSVLITGDANIAKDQRIELGNQLKTLLPAEDFVSGHSIWSLGRFIPGLTDDKDPENRVFSSTNSSEVSETLALKRLGSPMHYRFYFALTGPKTVMPDEEFNNLLELAETNVGMLEIRLTEEVKKRRRSGKTWFEHVLDRLDDKCISSFNEDTLVGFVHALANMMDTALREDGGQRMFSLSLDGTAKLVANNCLRQLHAFNPERQAEVVREIARKGNAINWLVGMFFRSHLFSHGKVGDNAESANQWEISDEVLDQAIEILKERTNRNDTKDLIPTLPDVSAYLFGWLNIADDDQAVHWVRDFCKTDEGFVTILNHLRGWSMSDRVYYPLSKGVVTKFLDWDDTLTRLDQLEDSEFKEQAIALKRAIEDSQH